MTTSGVLKEQLAKIVLSLKHESPAHFKAIRSVFADDARRAFAVDLWVALTNKQPELQD